MTINSKVFVFVWSDWKMSHIPAYFSLIICKFIHQIGLKVTRAQTLGGLWSVKEKCLIPELWLVNCILIVSLIGWIDLLVWPTSDGFTWRNRFIFGSAFMPSVSGKSILRQPKIRFYPQNSKKKWENNCYLDYIVSTLCAKIIVDVGITF